MTLNAFFSDPKRRNLALLAAVALVSAVFAAVALERRAAMVAPKYSAHAFFPDLGPRLTEVTRIHIASKKGGSFDVAFVPMKGWVLPGRANYPASFTQVKQTLTALAALETIEPKTDRPDWFGYVDLDPPPAGGGVEITLSADKDHPIAALIVGKSEDIGDDSGATGLFVRRPGDDQSWLVKSVAGIKASPADWIDRKVMSVDRDRIAEADVRPASGPAYSVSRAKPSDADFMLAPMPKGRELSFAGSPDGVAAAIVDFSFDDIKPSGELDFTKDASRLVTKTFDGLIVTTDVIKQGDDYWARVVADSLPGKPDTAREARDINAHADGWAFKLEPYKGATFATSLESLLKPKAGKK